MLRAAQTAERQIVALVVGGSSPLTQPMRAWPGGQSDRLKRCAFRARAPEIPPQFSCLNDGWAFLRQNEHSQTAANMVYFIGNAERVHR